MFLDRNSHAFRRIYVTSTFTWTLFTLFSFFVSVIRSLKLRIAATGFFHIQPLQSCTHRHLLPPRVTPVVIIVEALQASLEHSTSASDFQTSCFHLPLRSSVFLFVLLSTAVPPLRNRVVGDWLIGFTVHSVFGLRSSVFRLRLPTSNQMSPIFGFQKGNGFMD